MNAQVQTANFVVDWKEGDSSSHTDLKLTKIYWAENINQFEESQHHHLKTTPKKKDDNVDEL